MRVESAGGAGPLEDDGKALPANSLGDVRYLDDLAPFRRPRAWVLADLSEGVAIGFIESVCSSFVFFVCADDPEEELEWPSFLVVPFVELRASCSCCRLTDR